jgi:N-acylneuraminate cytidylyltransferase
MRTIAIIPARGGSKRLPRKNLLPFGGRPLIAHTIRQAQESKRVDACYVSTEDRDVASVAIEYGARVISRPEPLASDHTTTPEVLQHGIKALAAEGVAADAIVLLQCTSPLRRRGDIDAAIELFIETQADTVVAGCVSHDFLWLQESGWAKSMNFDYRSQWWRGQDFPPQFRSNGSIFVYRRDILESATSIFAGDKLRIYPMDYWHSFQVDTQQEFRLCEWIWQNAMRDDEGGPRLRLHPRDIDLVVYDFDGVMTDNRAWVTQNGQESVAVCRADGLGVEAIRARGLPQWILSTEQNPVVRARADKLDIRVLQGIRNKRTALEQLLTEHGWAAERTVFIGNDVNDLEAMRYVGYPMAPQDAHPRARAIAKHVFEASGGAGVVREFAEDVLLT